MQPCIRCRDEKLSHCSSGCIAVKCTHLRPIACGLSPSTSAVQLVAVYGSWHLGQLQVGLSKAKRLCRCSSVRITTSHMLPMQVCQTVLLAAVSLLLLAIPSM